MKNCILFERPCRALCSIRSFFSPTGAAGKKTRSNNFTTKSGREGAKEVASVHYFVLNMFGNGISFISLPLHFDVF
jgi:hypothetical protein